MKLQNKTALITGAGRGIGKAIAVALAQEGADIILNYKENIDAAEKTAEVIEKLGRRVMLCSFDIRKKQEVIQAREIIQKRFQNFNILVNNAGINKPNDFHHVSEEDWDEVMNTNLKGPFLVSQTFASMINRNGAIVNIGSVSGQYGGPRTTHYAVSKGGLITLTHNMAIYFSKFNIRVNTVSPGLIESEMAGAAKGLGVEEKILLKRMGKASEVGKTVAFLVSDDASYITGQTINVNGGLLFS